ncbi:TetR/AcrR family transcriptional regulator [Photobacterium lutimaris]|uniref:TetR/AcrR family transcriptional regulator n=1 Tax=Photobacterium lutimaris TaxID=388278 RepID=A0A2T3IXD6_9GAMM|nr:TetR/AcrR family transcriptional regulator [Photobacterium lutimaris]PSU33183.1 TetR/AcrR family transcriptional regulator [Photobacterium lutimaris]TDR75240.1 TetR family transcriptional regulator [Photobacterium lutimaris]
MTTQVKARGRPRQEADQPCSQQAILDTARRLFLKCPYNKVTTRMISREAGVDVALIGYYFENKAGLYKAVFDDIYSPFFAKLNQLEKASSNRNTIEELFMTIFYLDIEHPELLGIIYKTLVLNDGPRRSYIDKSILAYTDAFHIKIFSTLQRKGFIDPNLDVILLKDSFNALVMTPFFFYPLKIEDSSQQETIAYLESLYRQNIRLFLYGCAVNESIIGACELPHSGFKQDPKYLP